MFTYIYVYTYVYIYIYVQVLLAPLEFSAQKESTSELQQVRHCRLHLWICSAKVLYVCDMENAEDVQDRKMYSRLWWCRIEKVFCPHSAQ